MSIALFLKNNLKNIPPSIGRILNKIPYSSRPGIGGTYKKRKDEIRLFDSYSNEQRKLFILERMQKIVGYAYDNVQFYKEYYKKMDFHPSILNSFEDINQIPIIDKSILSAYDIENRTSSVPNKYIVNTGGSSGTPFSLYIQPDSMGHEWAHMHYIWERLNYRPTDLKILFGGRSDLAEVVEYDVLRNHFAIDIYADYKPVARTLKDILKKYEIKFLHGYPSSIYDFAVFCKNEDKELMSMLNKSLKGAFLGSEFPHKIYRDTIEEVFNIETISWYGHTERAALAFEKTEKFKYEPFGTYGYSEALKLDDDNYQLIATSYYNMASPLIRYNTQDIISDIVDNNGIMESFKVTRGREGEYIFDKNNKKINLTGLIFGRHHEIFNYSKFIQVKQITKGEIEIHYVSDSISPSQAEDFFDSKNLNLDLSFIKRDEPIRTQSGKINLLIR